MDLKDAFFLIQVALIAALIAGSIPYILFPSLVRVFHFFHQPSRTANAFSVPDDSDWPEVDLVFAAYNEEAVLRDKLNSLKNLDYPKDRIKIWVGSDLSSDSTEQILASYATEMPNLHWERMPIRSGKSRIINHLVAKGGNSIIVGTDANILFHTMALKHLIAPFLSNPKVAMVGGELAYRETPTEENAKSIAREERSYLQWENRTKVCEGELWGATMGVEGGCYAIKRSAFVPIPNGTYMEDFYLTMQVLRSGEYVQHAALSTCTEDVSNNAKLEYRRKVRISHGNWQNLMRYNLTWSIRSFGIFLTFFCHKVLRWLFPFIVVGSIVWGTVQLYLSHDLKVIMANCLTLGAVTAIILQPRALLPAVVAKKIKPISYFAWMNLALIEGFYTYLTKWSSSSGIWEPTQRNNQ